MHRTQTDQPSGPTRRAVVGGAGAFAAILAFGLRRAAAQEATPDPEGVAGEVLGADLPSSPSGVELSLRRTVVAPGGGLPPHSHPGAIVLVVDAGTWGYTPLEGTVRLTRAAADGTPAPVEEPPLGVELILTAGDAIFAEDSRDEMRNAGDDDVVLLMATLNAVGEEFQTEP
jgi:hypothetical protein